MSLAYLLSPQSIFFPPYVLSALGLALLWLKRSHGLAFRDGLRLVFDRRTWITKSTAIDLAFCALNLVVLKSLLESFETGLVNAVFDWLPLKSPVTLQGPVWLEAILAMLVAMIAIDFATYIAHRLLHGSAFLWSAHSIHHSAEKLTPLTTFRQHPIELFFLNGLRVVMSSLALVVLYAVFPSETESLKILGLGAGFFVYSFTVNLHHSQIPVRYPPWLRLVFVSPHVHHIHHSLAERHQGRNFATVFSVWDRMFGTYCDEEVGLNDLRFGIEPSDHSNRSAIGLLLKPFGMLPARIRFGFLAAFFLGFLSFCFPLAAAAFASFLGF